MIKLNEGVFQHKFWGEMFILLGNLYSLILFYEFLPVFTDRFQNRAFFQQLRIGNSGSQKLVRLYFEMQYLESRVIGNDQEKIYIYIY